ncbi:MAG TPA: methyltransferase domain-containing protein [Vicinamibacterales bacterium]|nr:methyltransferase domain-containing protein [Vicinamibacterales bacterium]
MAALFALLQSFDNDRRVCFHRREQGAPPTTAPALLVVLLSAWPLATAHRDPQARDPEVEFEQIVQLLNVSSGKVVADVGAGDGSWTLRLAQRVGAQGRVYATEVRRPQVEGLRQMVRTRGLEHVEVITGSQQEMGLPSNCCDGLLLRLVYHAFDEPHLMRDSMRRAMKVGGLVLVVDFRPSPDQLTQEMKEAGFERVQFIERWQEQQGVFAALFRKGSARPGGRL